MMSYDKSDIRFVLSILENLLLVKKMEKIELGEIFLGTNKSDLYRNGELLFQSNQKYIYLKNLIYFHFFFKKW